MKIKFKSQAYQTAAVDAVIDCFQGQPKISPLNYRLDKGLPSTPMQQGHQATLDIDNDEGFRNPDIKLDESQLSNTINEQIGK